MKAIITGAGGFVGRELTEQLLVDGVESITLVDLKLSPAWLADDNRVTKIEGGLQDAAVLAQLLEQPCTHLFHLAALPGGASEAEPELSKKINLDGTIALFTAIAENYTKPRIIYTSTIAVLGAPMPARVNDVSPIVPSITYGTHKAMVELALADMSRRGLVDSVAVRLPGIVARPAASTGLKSAFMSNVFHALKAGDSFVSPVSEKATMWMMSVEKCAQNLIHAANLNSDLMPLNRVVTLPAVRVRMDELVTQIAQVCAVETSLVSYQADGALEAGFGNQPPFETPAAEKAGFSHDGNLLQLVNNAMTTI